MPFRVLSRQSRKICLILKSFLEFPIKWFSPYLLHASQIFYQRSHIWLSGNLAGKKSKKKIYLTSSDLLF